MGSSAFSALETQKSPTPSCLPQAPPLSFSWGRRGTPFAGNQECQFWTPQAPKPGLRGRFLLLLLQLPSCKVASSGLEWSLDLGTDCGAGGVWCTAIPSTVPPPGGLTAVKWTSGLITGDHQPQPGVWQPDFLPSVLIYGNKL